MPIRLSNLFLHTLREDPADIGAPSYRLLARAGYVRQSSPGCFTWLPLGLAVLASLERVVREELVAIGAQEVRLPSPGAKTEARASRRPGHGEPLALLAAGDSSSYRDLPVTLFRIQTTRHDEAGLRAGELRERELVTADACSLDLDDAGLAASYGSHRHAYERVLARLGLDARIVRAVPSARPISEALVAPAAGGKDAYVHCTTCDYAATLEAAEIAVPPPGGGEHPPSYTLDTPGATTIATLVDALVEQHPEKSWQAADTLKSVVVKVRAPGEASFEPLVVGVPGDRVIDLHRLAAQLGVEVEPATGEELASDGRLIRGYLGPHGLAALGLRLVVDPLVAPGTVWVTGANEPGRHLVGVVAGRDFAPDATAGAVEVRDGDRCPCCGARLLVAHGVEVGHLVRHGRQLAETLGFDVLGPDGRPVRPTAGTYDLDLSRALAALVEQTRDEHGLRWPRAVSPAEVHVVVARKGADAESAAADLASGLETLGLRVLLDDRPGLSPGVRFADAELVGVPLVVTIGRGLADGVIEMRDRWSGKRRDLPLATAAAVLLEELALLR